MALGHALRALLSAVLLGTAITFLFFNILAGVTNRSPLSRTYYLQADTSGMTGAHPVTQWTYLYTCGEGNTDCGSAHPAMPFGNAWAPGASNVPSELIGSHGGGTTSSFYFYMWRFGWVFTLMALFFAVLALLGTLFACCGRLGSAVSALLTLLSLIFLSIAAALMTATFVKARNVFHANGRSASLGRYAFGFTWGAWAATLGAMLLLCMGMKRKNNRTTAARDGTASSGGWRRRRSNRRGAGSFSKVNYDDGRLDNVSV